MITSSVKLPGPKAACAESYHSKGSLNRHQAMQVAGEQEVTFAHSGSSFEAGIEQE